MSVSAKSPKHKSFRVVVFFLEAEGVYSFVQRKTPFFFFNTTTLCKFHLFIGGLCEIRIASNFEKDNYTIELARLDFSSLDSGI